MRLVRKGSGSVEAVADIVECKSPLTSLSDYAASGSERRIAPANQEVAFAGDWRTPGGYANARRLARPVPHEHKSAAVIWANIDPGVADAIKVQLA